MLPVLLHSLEQELTTESLIRYKNCIYLRYVLQLSTAATRIVAGDNMCSNKWVHLSCLALVMLLVLPGSSLSKEVIINAMIDFDSPASPTPDQVTQAFNSIVNLTNPMDSRGLNATIFASSDVVTSQKLFVTILGQKTNHELALNGNPEDEKLSSMPYSKQLELLTTAQKNINSAHVCGGKVVSIGGFRPQSFDQNNNTLKVLESLGFLYDAGFVVGTFYLPGHKNDTWPYPIMGYNLYAVPVSSYNSSGVRVNLSDRYAKEELGISGSKWRSHGCSLQQPGFGFRRLLRCLQEFRQLCHLQERQIRHHHGAYQHDRSEECIRQASGSFSFRR